MQKNISIKEYTTFKTGGAAKYFYIVKNKKDLIEATEEASKLNLPFFILGGGSNLLISDEGFDGLIIKMENADYFLQDSKILAGAGIKLGELINICLAKDLTGLEWAAGIPGTLGGAIYGNAGAFDEKISDSILSVEFFDVKTKEFKILKNKDCGFNYRESVFKKNKDWIILSAELFFEKGDREKIKNKISGILNQKKEKQPLDFPSAGSIFKNGPNFFAAELIEKCNLKGKQIGGAKISEKHANFIVNCGQASSAEVKELIDLAKKSVKDKFGIILEEEVQYLGFKNLKK